jgi:hypothetical protein
VVVHFEAAAIANGAVVGADGLDLFADRAIATPVLAQVFYCFGAIHQQGFHFWVYAFKPFVVVFKRERSRLVHRVLNSDFFAVAPFFIVGSQSFNFLPLKLIFKLLTTRSDGLPGLMIMAITWLKTTLNVITTPIVVQSMPKYMPRRLRKTLAMIVKKT